MPHVNVRHAEPDDYEAVHRIMSSPRAAAGTLQLPLQPAEAWRKRPADPPEGLFLLAACVDVELVGNPRLETSPDRSRGRQVGCIGMPGRVAGQGGGGA